MNTMWMVLDWRASATKRNTKLCNRNSTIKLTRCYVGSETHVCRVDTLPTEVRKSRFSQLLVQLRISGISRAKADILQACTVHLVNVVKIAKLFDGYGMSFGRRWGGSTGLGNSQSSRDSTGESGRKLGKRELGKKTSKAAARLRHD